MNNEVALFSGIYAVDVENTAKFIKKSLGVNKVGIDAVDGIPSGSISFIYSVTNVQKILQFHSKLVNYYGWEIVFIKPEGSRYIQSINGPTIDLEHRLNNIYSRGGGLALFVARPMKLPSRNFRTADPYYDYLFHVTDRKNLSKILTKGLTPRRSEIGSPYKFPELVHLLRSIDGYIVNLEGNKIHTNDLNISDPVLLKIGPTTKMNNIFYQDPFSAESVITYEPVSPKFIREVKSNELQSIKAKYTKGSKFEVLEYSLKLGGFNLSNARKYEQEAETYHKQFDE